MTDGPEKLERVVDALLREQPPRRAPATLEARVLAQIALQQAPIPWWRKGFTHWPVAARVVFLLASYGFIRLALAGVMSVIAFVRSGEVAGTAMSWVHTSGEAVSATASAAALVVHAVPPMWLYGTAAFGFALYAVLFGLGTVAYRTLYVQR
jgi:hypothetical protein